MARQWADHGVSLSPGQSLEAGRGMRSCLGVLPIRSLTTHLLPPPASAFVGAAPLTSRASPALRSSQNPLLLSPRRNRRGARPQAFAQSLSLSQAPAAMSPTGVSVILGTMTFGWARSSGTVDAAVAGAMVDAFLDAGHKDIDTALIYSDGNTERILGEILPPGGARDGRMGTLATKGGPWQGTSMQGSGGLSAAELRGKMEASLGSLGRERVGLYYLHAPDAATPIEETLAEVDRQHGLGRFAAFGLSNYQAWEVAHIYHHCAAKGYIKPTVYQGMYNAVTRDVEKELLPCLRKLGIAFYAYNPLAGGVLTGKHGGGGGEVAAGRFKENKMYQDRFYKGAYLAAALELKQRCEAEGVSPAEASLRWLAHHSRLRGGDAVIVGASSMQHLQQNLEALQSSKGRLSDSLAAAMEDAWEACSKECPPYARGFSLS